MSRSVEWSAKEWAQRSAALRDVTVVHGCGALEPVEAVFVCRAPAGRFACGRYVGACLGGDNDNRCVDCHVAYLRDLKKRIVEHVRLAVPVRDRHGNLRGGYRGELAIVDRFRVAMDSRFVEDVLFELVNEKKLFWFGDNEKPLKYTTRRSTADREEARRKEREERADAKGWAA